MKKFNKTIKSERKEQLYGCKCCCISSHRHKWWFPIKTLLRQFQVKSFSRYEFRETFITEEVEIPESAQREAKLLFHHEMINFMEAHQIFASLVINFYQTSSKYSPVLRPTKTERGTKNFNTHFKYK